MTPAFSFAPCDGLLASKVCYDPAMRLMLAALVATLTIAVVAAVFAIWPVIADAPWEDEIVAVTPVDRTSELRCQEGLDMRERAVFEEDRSTAIMEAILLVAQDEIDTYC